ncbi:helix-turn-helix domain-containing protein [Enterococcus sp. RIT-PI-f]|uniref:helix-turn-helix domain-containing protein n=1 Tax=Enterococcus sp. RIT-PI-f TaxID=1690244 RepID=UPI0006B89C1F|nr:helix-turn-helix domain-containing protein [Enterococcus sp. RIT-PI-f]KPG70186.1 hypothetical protein AEQ18_09805 [Enterococcus sp. RIT-PI-f]
MFGLSINTRIKKDLLHILDNQTDFVPTKDLVAQIDYANHYVVRKSLNELFEEIRKHYLPEQLSLKINKHRGVQLFSEDGNLHDLIHHFISEDVVYKILMTVLEERCTPSEKLCETLFISESSLRRRLKEINVELAHYDVRMTFSKHIRIHGPEHMIRIIHFVLLFYVARQLDNLPVLVDKPFYQRMANEVCDSLSLTATTHQKEILALFLLATNHAVQKNQTLNYTQAETAFFSKIEIPPKPDFLTGWTLLDWRFLVIAIFSADWAGFGLTLDLTEVMAFSKTEPADVWLASFEHAFEPITIESRDFIREKVYKQLLSDKFFRLDNALLEMFQFVDYSSMLSLYPFYMHRFDIFWQRFIAEYPEYDTLFSRQSNLLLAIYLVPVMTYFPEIKLYNYSHLTVTSSHYIEQRVTAHFYSRYKLIFTEDMAEAQVIIGTHTPDKDLLRSDQTAIVIGTSLSNCDLSRIEKAIETSITQLIS